jgi:hypothetical protein
MTRDDLRVLTERLLNQLEWEFGTPEDKDHFVVLAEDDRTLLIEVGEMEDAQGTNWPLLVLSVPLLHEVDVEAADLAALSDLNSQAPIGTVVLDANDRSLTVVHEAVGWPGAAEYRATMEMLVSSAMYVEEKLAGGTSGSAPPKYSELVE